MWYQFVLNVMKLFPNYSRLFLVCLCFVCSVSNGISTIIHVINRLMNGIVWLSHADSPTGRSSDLHLLRHQISSNQKRTARRLACLPACSTHCNETLSKVLSLVRLVSKISTKRGMARIECILHVGLHHLNQFSTCQVTTKDECAFLFGRFFGASHRLFCEYSACNPL